MINEKNEIDMAAIPEYIIKAARKYASEYGGGRKVEDAFIAGYKTTRQQPKQEERELTDSEKQLFEECWKAYGRKGSKKDSLSAWRGLTADEMLHVMPHVMAYVASREPRFKKDFQRYLAHRTFNDIVMDASGQTLYDPKKVETADSQPDLFGEQYSQGIIIDGQLYR